MYPESRCTLKSGYTCHSEWTCESSPKIIVGADGNPTRYQLGAYDSMQQSGRLHVNLGGTAGAKAFVP